MKSVVKPKFHQYGYIKINKTRRFRNDDIRLGKRQHNLAFLNNTLNNPILKYRVITMPLEGGTYQFKIRSLDDLNNINTGVDTNGTITDKLWYPSLFAISDIIEATDDNDITFTWSPPLGGLSVDNYIIYGNGGSGYTIDRGTPLATVSGSTFTATVEGLVDGTWFFVIESEASSVETVNYFTLKQVLPQGDDPGDPNGPGEPAIDPFDADFQLPNVSLKNVSIGKCGIEFVWTFGNKASYFQVFHDSGTGTIDWGTYKFRFARQNKIVQSFVTAQILTADVNTTYKFGIRAESPSGVVGTNLQEFEVVLDGKAPNEVTDTTTGAV